MFPVYLHSFFVPINSPVVLRIHFLHTFLRIISLHSFLRIIPLHSPPHNPHTNHSPPHNPHTNHSPPHNPQRTHKSLTTPQPTHKSLTPPKTLVMKEPHSIPSISKRINVWITAPHPLSVASKPKTTAPHTLQSQMNPFCGMLPLLIICSRALLCQPPIRTRFA